MDSSDAYDDSDLAARRESMLDILGSWDLDGKVPDENGLAIVRDYVAGRIELDEMTRLMTAHAPDGAGSAPSGSSPSVVFDLAEVVHSAGVVFDRLSVGREVTEFFLRTGRFDGISSRHDLRLLEDLRDGVQVVLDRRGSVVDGGLATAINAALSRAASIEPGELRDGSRRVGVATVHGFHEPPYLDEEGLVELVMRHAALNPEERALRLFVDVARAQPFWDGNKRTALLLANAVLLEAGSGMLLTAPMDDDDPSVARTFLDLLARAYVFDEVEAVVAMLRGRGLRPHARRSAREDWSSGREGGYVVIQEGADEFWRRVRGDSSGT